MVKNIITLLIIILLFVVYQMIFNNFSNKLVLSLESKNKELKREFDSLKNINKEFIFKMDSIQKNIDSIKLKENELASKYQSNKETIKIIQTKYNKNNYIDTFKSSNIIKYFKDSL